MSHSTTTNDKAATAKPAEKANPGLLLAMLAADWVVGDKHHYAEIRHQALLALAEAGKDGAEALARLEGLSGVVHAAPAAKAYPPG
jgi:hypothetical protein